MEKSQIARQMKNYKDKKYRPKDVVLSQLPEQIKEAPEEGIGMEYIELVSSMLTKMCNSKRDLGSRDLTNYAVVIGEFPPVALDLCSAFRVGGYIGRDILVRAVETWTTIASEEFPKSIARLPDANLEFQVCNRQQKKIFIVQGVNLRDSFLGTQAVSFPEDKSQYFRSFLYDLLFEY